MLNSTGLFGLLPYYYYFMLICFIILVFSPFQGVLLQIKRRGRWEIKTWRDRDFFTYTTQSQIDSAITVNFSCFISLLPIHYNILLQIFSLVYISTTAHILYALSCRVSRWRYAALADQLLISTSFRFSFQSCFSIFLKEYQFVLESTYYTVFLF